MLADKGSEGCESLLKYVENENDEVVGSVNEKGMVVKGSNEEGDCERVEEVLEHKVIDVCHVCPTTSKYRGGRDRR